MWPYRDSLAPSASGWRKRANVSETSPTKRRRAGREEQEKRRGKRPFFLLAWYSAVAAVSQIPLVIQASIQTFPGHPLCARQIRIPGGGGTRRWVEVVEIPGLKASDCSPEVLRSDPGKLVHPKGAHIPNAPYF